MEIGALETQQGAKEIGVSQASMDISRDPVEWSGHGHYK